MAKSEIAGVFDIYRDGELYASYTTGGPMIYAGGVPDVVMGFRR